MNTISDLWASPSINILKAADIYPAIEDGRATMSSFLRGKQAGVQRDFSSGLDPRLFAVDQVGGLELLRGSSAHLYLR